MLGLQALVQLQCLSHAAWHLSHAGFSRDGLSNLNRDCLGLADGRAGEETAIDADNIIVAHAAVVVSVHEPAVRVLKAQRLAGL